MNLVDLSLVSMLSFKSLDSMHYSWSFEELKFDMKIYFDRSMRFLMLNAMPMIDSCSSLFRLHEYVLISNFWKKCSSTFMYACCFSGKFEEDDAGPKATVSSWFRPRFSVFVFTLKPLPNLRVYVVLVAWERHAPLWLAEASVNETVRLG